jgi:hypothetical protein
MVKDWGTTKNTTESQQSKKAVGDFKQGMITQEINKKVYLSE